MNSKGWWASLSEDEQVVVAAKVELLEKFAQRFLGRIQT